MFYFVDDFTDHRLFWQNESTDIFYFLNCEEKAHAWVDLISEPDDVCTDTSWMLIGLSELWHGVLLADVKSLWVIQNHKRNQNQLQICNDLSVAVSLPLWLQLLHFKHISVAFYNISCVLTAADVKNDLSVFFQFINHSVFTSVLP